MISVSSFCTKESAVDKTLECYRFISGGKKIGAKFQSFLGTCKLFYTEGKKEEEGGMTLLMSQDYEESVKS